MTTKKEPKPTPVVRVLHVEKPEDAHVGQPKGTHSKPVPYDEKGVCVCCGNERGDATPCATCGN